MNFDGLDEYISTHADEFIEFCTQDDSCKELFAKHLIKKGVNYE
jgi:hypothetical protein